MDLKRIERKEFKGVELCGFCFCFGWFFLVEGGLCGCNKEFTRMTRQLDTCSTKKKPE